MNVSSRCMIVRAIGTSACALLVLGERNNTQNRTTNS